MQTSLPELPFSAHANPEVIPGFHTTIKTTSRQFPRTDLHTLAPWTTFPNDIHDAILSATTSAGLSSEPFNIDTATKSRIVVNEEGIRFLAMSALHDPVEQILSRLGCDGYFIQSGGRNVAMIGLPDLAWITSSEKPQPKLVVCG
jgi:hypothetical protein